MADNEEVPPAGPPDPNLLPQNLTPQEEPPPAPEIKIDYKANFWLRKQDALLKGNLLDTPPPVRDVLQLRSIERRYAEGSFKPGLIAPGSVTAVRITDWTQDIDFDVIGHDDKTMFSQKLTFARFYLTSAMWQETDVNIEHYIHNQYFLWPIHATEVFSGYTMDEMENNTLLDAPGIKDVRAWEYLEDAFVNHKIPPPYWSRPPAIWDKQFQIDTEWLGHWVHNRIWGKVYKLEQFLNECFLVTRDPVFMGSTKALRDPSKKNEL